MKGSQDPKVWEPLIKKFFCFLWILHFLVILVYTIWNTHALLFIFRQNKVLFSIMKLIMTHVYKCGGVGMWLGCCGERCRGGGQRTGTAPAHLRHPLGKKTNEPRTREVPSCSTTPARAERPGCQVSANRQAVGWGYSLYLGKESEMSLPAKVCWAGTSWHL